MKTILLTIAILLMAVFTTCKREVVHYNTVAAQSNDDLAFTDTLRIPINDLGAGTFLGRTGGLYPGGVNMPFGAYATDLIKFARSIKPRDAAGVVTSSGVVGFIAIGGSTAGKMMTALTNKTIGNPLTNASLKMANATNGEHSSSANSLINPNDSIWIIIKDKLNRNDLAYTQVQVIYLETDDSTQTGGFPDRPLKLKQDYLEVMHIFKSKFPNIRLVYLLGRTTTFLNPDKLTIHNVEPSPYYNGWACKWLIEDQMNGVPGTRYKGVNAEMPLITWGWYEWAYGTSQPRQDGFTWEESDTVDGLHGTPAGEDTLSNYFQNFLLTDPYAKVWYAKK
ncbi:hypothetical protein BH10BAC2_BH10BAC2_22980 [soil metagenome]